MQAIGTLHTIQYSMYYHSLSLAETKIFEERKRSEKRKKKKRFRKTSKRKNHLTFKTSTDTKQGQKNLQNYTLETCIKLQTETNLKQTTLT